MESLLKNRHYPNMQGNKGNTPLHIAILNENLPAVKLLLVYEANLFIKNEKGQTPYDLSQEKILVNDLFLNDKEINSIVRVQVHNSKLDDLEELNKPNKRYGNIFNLCKVTESKIKKVYPISTLKELCVNKVWELTREC